MLILEGKKKKDYVLLKCGQQRAEFTDWILFSGNEAWGRKAAVHLKFLLRPIERNDYVKENWRGGRAYIRFQCCWFP